MVFLANPNNPTGTYLPFDEVKRLATHLPGHVLLVLDAAYAEYATRADYVVRRRACLGQRKRRDDKDVFEDIRPCRAQAWMVLCAAQRM